LVLISMLVLVPV